MTQDRITNLEQARRAWGKAAPEWVVVLAEACDRTSQTRVAKRLGRSNTLICQVLLNTYTRLDDIERRVRGELMNETVVCPVLGDITSRRCVDAQSRPYAATNALRIELRRACPRCPHYMRKEAT